jgi:hypothetical protein
MIKLTADYTLDSKKDEQAIVSLILGIISFIYPLHIAIVSYLHIGFFHQLIGFISRFLQPTEKISFIMNLISISINFSVGLLSLTILVIGIKMGVTGLKSTKRKVAIAGLITSITALPVVSLYCLFIIFNYNKIFA